MHIIKIAILMSVGLTLASCQTVAERRAEQDVDDHLTCNDFGAKRGTDAYVKCRTDLQRNRELRRTYNRPMYVSGGFYPYGGFCRQTFYGVRCY